MPTGIIIDVMAVVLGGTDGIQNRHQTVPADAASQRFRELAAEAGNSKKTKCRYFLFCPFSGQQQKPAV